MQQILGALLYKKTVIWTDLKIQPGATSDNSNVIYASEKVVEVKNKIDDFMSTLGYLPSRYTYKPITTLEQEEVEQGIFTQQPPESELYEDREPQGTDFTKLLETVIECNTDMENLIKDKFLFSKEKIQGFLDSNVV